MASRSLSEARTRPGPSPRQGYPCATRAVGVRQGVSTPVGPTDGDEVRVHAPAGTRAPSQHRHRCLGERQESGGTKHLGSRASGAADVVCDVHSDSWACRSGARCRGGVGAACWEASVTHTRLAGNVPQTPPRRRHCRLWPPHSAPVVGVPRAPMFVSDPPRRRPSSAYTHPIRTVDFKGRRGSGG